MSEANGKVCCNCRHCKRVYNKLTNVECRCELDNCYLGYLTVMSHCCRHWARERSEHEDIKTNKGN